MPSNAHKTLTDAGYIVVGLGVMGFQQAQIRARATRAHVSDAGSCLAGRARDAQSKLGTHTQTARTQAEVQVRQTVGRAQRVARRARQARRAGCRSGAGAARRLAGAGRAGNGACCGTRSRRRRQRRLTDPPAVLALAALTACTTTGGRVAGVLATLAGGVGAARFLAGLVRVVPASEVVAIVNTADDDEFHGLYVSPDLDSVTYTLAGAANVAQGWGLEGETFATLDALDRYDVDTWFRLGDKDLATHLYRTNRMREGAPLSDVTAEITHAWSVGARLLPMTDDPVRTRITVQRGPGRVEEIAMQRWFVGERAGPPVVSVRFDGAETARPAPGVLDALAVADTIVICPSNPVISIAPILAIPGVRERAGRTARSRRRRQPDRRRRAREGPRRPAHGPARHRRVVRRRCAELRRVL